MILEIPFLCPKCKAFTQKMLAEPIMERDFYKCEVCGLFITGLEIITAADKLRIKQSQSKLESNG